jgi:hypothetical protein
MPMIAADDSWFVRFPDGRVVRAANTTVVRRNIEQRHIPLGSMVRRSEEEPWTPLERSPQFGEILDELESPRPRESRQRQTMRVATVSSRLDPQVLHTVGVRGMLTELLAALDTALTRLKLKAAAIVLVFAAAVLVVARLLTSYIEGVATPVWLAAAALLWLVLVVARTVLAKLTCVELIMMRPARWSDGVRRLPGTAFRLALTDLAVALYPLLLVGLVYSANELLTVTRAPWDILCILLAVILAVVAGVVAMTTPLMLAFAFLLGPILVVEECSWFRAVGIWLALLRRKLGRVLLDELLAIALTVGLAVPFVLLSFTLDFIRLDEKLGPARDCAREALLGLVLTPALAFFVIANVFIYLNLRLEELGRR